MNSHPKYHHVLQCVIFILLLVSFGGCGMFSYFRPIEEICDDEEAPAYDSQRFYDSLQLAEYHRHYDSCEMVLQAEWDSIMRVMIDSLGEARFAEVMADSIIAYASEFMHTPYRYGGNGPKAFDCSGFTRYVFRRFGFDLKRSVVGQLDDGRKRIDDTAELRRGDLVFFGGRRNPKRMGHVAIVVDIDPDSHVFTFIHSTIKKGVIISASNEKYYRIRYMTACRILPD